MATEKRPIDANALMKAIRSFRWVGPPNTLKLMFEYLWLIIRDQPTVDAVEVVRCNDCKKWFRHTEVDRERGECRRYQTTKHETGYCDRGERKYNE